MADVERLIARLEVQQRAFERQLARAAQTTNSRAAQIERRFAQTNKTVTAQFAAMGTQVNSVLRTLALPTLTVGGGMLLARQVRSAVSDLSDLGKAARDVGLDVEELQALQRGFARESRVSADQATQAFERFNRRVGEAVNGAGPLATTVRRYGIELRNANGEVRSQSELLREVADRMRDAQSAQERSAIGQAAFGDVGRQMAAALAEGGDSFDRMIAEAQRAGDVIQRDVIQRAELLDDKFDQLTRSAARFFKSIAVSAFGGGVETPLDALERMFGTIERAQQALGPDLFAALTRELGPLDDAADAVGRLAQHVEGLARPAQDAHAALRELYTELRALGEHGAAREVGALASEFRRVIAAFEAGEVSASDFGAEVERVQARALDLVGAVAELDDSTLAGITGRFGWLLRVVSEVTGAVRGLKGEMSDVVTEEGVRVQTAGPGTPRPRMAPRDIDFGLPPAARGGGSGGGGSSPGDFERAVQQIRERTEALEAEAVAMLSAADAGEGYARALDMARMRSQLLIAAQREGVEVTGETVEMVERMAVAYADAAERIREIGEAQAEAARRAQAMQSAFEDAFVSFVTGANSARDAARSLLQSLARLAAQQAFTSLAGALGFSLPGRATGGPVRAGGAYLVNENTPQSEVFVPSQSGGILNVPQAQAALRGAAGGGRVDVYIHEAPGFAAKVQTVAQGVAVQTVTAGLREYDRDMLPARVGQIGRDPRRRG